jgi:hypothetical protein
VGLLSVLGLVISLSAANRPLAPGHVPRVTKWLEPTGDLPAATPLHLAIGLPVRDPRSLSNFLANLYDPASPDCHHYLTPQEFTARFGPTEDQYQAVIAFLRAHNLNVVARHSNRLLLDVAGAATDAQKAFNIRLRMYRRPGGKGEFFAPNIEPTVPAEIAILDVTGLSNYRPPYPLIRKAASSPGGADARPHSGSGSRGTYMGGDFRAAYVPGVLLDGTGQSIGLVEFDGFYSSDIVSYQTQAGLPAAPVTTVLLDGYDGNPTENGNSEVSGDIELTMAMAPGLSQVISYEAGPSGIPNDILNRMTTDNLCRQLSCSWGWTGGPSAATDEILQEMAAQGQSIFCASGDCGAYNMGAMDDPSEDDTPSDSPYLTSVGGTTLTTSGPGGPWVSETVWNDGDGSGSSGGVSGFYSLPAWQEGISMAANGGSITMRNICDVALIADNILVDYGNGQSGSYSGTSCAAPLWASFIALVNEQLAGHGQPPVGFVNPALYAIGKGPNYEALFHDITTGNNTNSASPNEFYAVPGFDLCTGWGTPAGIGLVNALAPLPDPLIISPPTGVISEGLTGGPFTLSSTIYSLTNSGAAGLTWSLASASPWLRVSSTGGDLPSESATSVSVSLTAAADALDAGTNTATLWFTDDSTGSVFTRQFTLIISSQLVQNGAFETGNFDGWTQSGNTTYTTVTSGNLYVRSGMYGAQLGPNNTPGFLSQTLATVPGRPYLLSFWLDNPKSGTPNEFSAWWNGASVFSQSNLPELSWTNLQFIGWASSTNTLLQFGFLDDPAYLGIDDITVTPIRGPSLQILSVKSSTAQFSLQTAAGLTCQVQYSTNLLSTNWANLGQPFTATESITSFSDNGAADPQRFYRVIVNP